LKARCLRHGGSRHRNNLLLPILIVGNDIERAAAVAAAAPTPNSVRREFLTVRY